MDLKRLLNSDEPKQSSPRKSSSDHQQLSTSRPAHTSRISPSTCNQPHRHPALHLDTLSRTLPPLSRSISDDSSDSRSPLTPNHSPPLSFERDKRHFHPAGPQRLPSDIVHQRKASFDRRSSTSHSATSATRSMDSFAFHQGDFSDSMPFPSMPQAATAQMQPSSIPQQPLPELSANIPMTPLPSLDQSNFQPSSSRTGATKATKKNSYPCPLAKQYQCPEHFTTSGHAARHAKKHTGKKDAICPECQKAFTRKDNMEQHRRTHQAGRTNSKPTVPDESRQRKAMKMQQNHKRAASDVPAMSQETSTSTSDPEMPQQPMPSSLVDPHMGMPVDNMQPMGMLDPQLGSPMGSTSFPEDVLQSSGALQQMTMQGMPYGQYAMPVPNVAGSRPRLQRSSYGSDLQHRLQPAASFPSPSSSSSEMAEPRSPSGSLDVLANAASQMASE